MARLTLRMICLQANPLLKERLGVPPARCIVLEDALAGIEAARAAGMRCIGVSRNGKHLRLMWWCDLSTFSMRTRSIICLEAGISVMKA